MSAKDFFEVPGNFRGGTLAELFFETVERFGDRVCYRGVDRSAPVPSWTPLSFREVHDQVRAIHSALASLGLERGDRVAILSENRPEWALADWACICGGLVDVPVYSTLSPPQIRFLLHDSEARAICVADEIQLAKVLEIRRECPALQWVIVFDPPSGALPEGVLSWAALRERGEDPQVRVSAEAFRAGALQVSGSDLATLIYTSGTTGDPKGVMLSHGNIRSNVEACRRVLPIDEQDETLSFLPLSHVFQRTVDYLLFGLGCTITYARSIDSVADDLKIVRPTVVVSVPRLYEKVHARITGATGVKGRLVQWAREVGDAWATERLEGREPGLILRTVYALADRLVFRKVKEAVGGRLRFFVSGGAPLSPEINRFFYSAGILILEGYGLTETSPVTNVNTLTDFRIGTVGKPVPGTRIRIESDGEILIQGPQVMQGYYRNPEATAEVLGADGWFRTGDIGSIDEDGFLRITDRKKDILITSGGKNIAPQGIENRIKQNRFVDQAVMIGDRRPFPVVLLLPAWDRLEEWAAPLGIVGADRGALAADPRVHQLLLREVAAATSELARFEQPKRIGIITGEFTIAGGELTPSQKVRRRVVERRYSGLVDRLYEEGSERALVLFE